MVVQVRVHQGHGHGGRPATTLTRVTVADSRSERRQVGKCSGDGVEELAAGLLAAPAAVCADAAVLHVLGVRRALVAAALACRSAGLEEGTVRLASYSVCRERLRLATKQTSAQSRSSRMHFAIFVTSFSDRHASADWEHVLAQSTRDSMVWASSSASTLKGVSETGWSTASTARSTVAGCSRRKPKTRSFDKGGGR